MKIAPSSGNFLAFSDGTTYIGQLNPDSAIEIHENSGTPIANVPSLSPDDAALAALDAQVMAIHEGAFQKLTESGFLSVKPESQTIIDARNALKAKIQASKAPAPATQAEVVAPTSPPQGV